MELLFGVTRNVVVLFSGPSKLSQTPITFKPLANAEVVGNSSEVCVVLAGGVPGRGSDKEVQRLLGNAKIIALAEADDGATYELKCPGSGWRLQGFIVPENEITACVILSCGKRSLRVGLKVNSVALSSTETVQALGAYWQSTNAYDGN